MIIYEENNILFFSQFGSILKNNILQKTEKERRTLRRRVSLSMRFFALLTFIKLIGKGSKRDDMFLFSPSNCKCDKGDTVLLLSNPILLYSALPFEPFHITLGAGLLGKGDGLKILNSGFPGPSRRYFDC